MRNYSNCAKSEVRFFQNFIYGFLLIYLSFNCISANAQQVYFVDSSGHCNYQTPEQIDAAFKANQQTPDGWKPVNGSAIWNEADRIPTYVFVHGNMTDRTAAMTDGTLIQSYLNGIIPDKNYRLVIWFWDSSRTDLPLRQDAINSERRSLWESFYLARFLQTAPANASIKIIGYSFGANTVLGAMQLISGGTVNGYACAGSSGQLQVLLIAPAVPTGAFLTGTNGWGLALKSVQRCDVTVNQTDKALKWYPFVAADGQSSAMGFAGIDGVPAEQKGKIFYYDVTCQVGRTHALADYLGKTGVFQTFAAK